MWTILCIWGHSFVTRNGRTYCDFCGKQVRR